MSDIISVLPDSIANQIAAGEVIQRPASVLKELVENAIDAGAHTIKIEVEDAGKALLRVTDDGCGMSAMDARMCFERHATSKIKKAEDLFQLHSMGFRGEALASIASVAQVELVTRRSCDDVAINLLLDGSEIINSKELVAPVGSSFTVRNLFFNVPARRRFLKSNRTELHHLLEQFERIVLVYPEIAFTFIEDGKELVALPPGSIKKRICDMLGRQCDKGYAPIEFNSDVVQINGFVGLPSTAKKKTPLQYFFVNGRFMRHPYFQKAVYSMYDRLLPTGFKPNYFIYFTVDPSRIDVNIHPTKTEIKFLDEQSIYRILCTMLEQSLNKAMSMPSLAFDQEQLIDIPPYKPGEIQEFAYTPDLPEDPFYDPFVDASGKKKAEKTSFTRSLPMNDSQWSQSMSAFDPSFSVSQNNSSFVDRDTIIDPPLPSEEGLFSSHSIESLSLKPSSQHTTNTLLFEGRYILTTIKSGLVLIDALRAKSRILYNQYLRLFLNDEVKTATRLLFPQLLHFSAVEATFVHKTIDLLEGLGFEISPLGQGSFSLLSTPKGLNENAGNVIEGAIRIAMQSETEEEKDLKEILAREIAHHITLYASPVSSLEDAEEIIAEVFSSPNNTFTASGKQIYKILSLEDIKHLIP